MALHPRQWGNERENARAFARATYSLACNTLEFLFVFFFASALHCARLLVRAFTNLWTWLFFDRGIWQLVFCFSFHSQRNIISTSVNERSWAQLSAQVQQSAPRKRICERRWKQSWGRSWCPSVLCDNLIPFFKPVFFSIIRLHKETLNFSGGKQEMTLAFLWALLWALLSVSLLFPFFWWLWRSRNGFDDELA